MTSAGSDAGAAVPSSQSASQLEAGPAAAPSGTAGATSTSSDAAVSGDGAESGPDASPFASCPATEPAGAFPADVEAVLSARCQTCHKNPPINHAPFPLLTFADTQKADTLAGFEGEPIWQVMQYVIQTGSVPHMPFGNAPQLTASQFQTLNTWLLGCAVPVPSGEAGSEDASDDAPVPADAGGE